MKKTVLIILTIAAFTISCEEEFENNTRTISSNIVGKWYTITSTDSITHEYSTHGKLTVKEYQDGAEKYTGKFDYDIDGNTMEYWGERVDKTTNFTIIADTLWIEKFINNTYYMKRLE